MRFKIFIVPVVLAVAVLGLLFLPIPDKTQATSGIHSVEGYAWSSNIGWIKFGPDAGGSTFNYSTRQFGGYAWSSNIGWIKLDPLQLGPATVSSLTDGAKVTGWMRATSPVNTTGNTNNYNNRGGWDGKLSMSDPSGSKYAVTLRRLASRDEFRGFAWGDVVLGWVNFDQVYIGPECTGDSCVIDDPLCPDGSPIPEDGDCDDGPTDPTDPDWIGACTVNNSTADIEVRSGQDVVWTVTVERGVPPYTIEVKVDGVLMRSGTLTQDGHYSFKTAFTELNVAKRAVFTVTDSTGQTDSSGTACPTATVKEDTYEFDLNFSVDQIEVNRPGNGSHDSSSVVISQINQSGGPALPVRITVTPPPTRGTANPVSEYSPEYSPDQVSSTPSDGVTYNVQFANRGVTPPTANISSPYNGLWNLPVTAVVMRNGVPSTNPQETITRTLKLDYFDPREQSQ